MTEPQRLTECGIFKSLDFERQMPRRSGEQEAGGEHAYVDAAGRSYTCQGEMDLGGKEAVLWDGQGVGTAGDGSMAFLH